MAAYGFLDEDPATRYLRPTLTNKDQSNSSGTHDGKNGAVNFFQSRKADFLAGVRVRTTELYVAADLILRRCHML